MSNDDDWVITPKQPTIDPLNSPRALRLLAEAMQRALSPPAKTPAKKKKRVHTGGM